jgi:hypothetical protein
MLRRIQTFGLLWLYAITTGIGAAFIAFCLPETGEKTAEEIADFYRRGSPNHPSIIDNESERLSTAVSACPCHDGVM